jgi:acyl dehydratase
MYAGLVGIENTLQVPGYVEDTDPAQTNHTAQLFLLSIVSGFLVSQLSDPDSKCINIQIEFLTKVNCGDQIETTIELSDQNPEKHLETYKVNSYNQRKEQVITGQAVMLVPG